MLWSLISLGFRFYVMHFGQYNKMYGTIGAAIVVFLWFYLAGLALLVGAELNAELEHASPYGKNEARRCQASVDTGCSDATTRRNRRDTGAQPRVSLRDSRAFNLLDDLETDYRQTTCAISARRRVPDIDRTSRAHLESVR